MIFNSFEFWIFLPIVFVFYWFVFKKNATQQNLLLLAASIFFYSWADWRFLGLILFSALFNFYIANKITDQEEENSKRTMFWVGVIFNVGVLAGFKYFNFFYEGFSNILNVFGNETEFTPLKIIIPLGISFFTFQTLGYVIDVYNEEIEPSKDLLSFITYVIYFPKLLSGPIERAENFLSQVSLKRDFKYTFAIEGLRQILWGLFKKTIADNCMELTNSIFDNYQTLQGSTLLLGAFLYAIEMYADFSGYSDMAIGVSKLFGINLINNFAFPFFSLNISDFWRKWHISLSSWMMNYVFTPLSFILRRKGKMGLIMSIITTFLIVGLWHGANWTYILYGFLHGCYFIPLILMGKMNTSGLVAQNRLFPSMKEAIQMLATFLLVMLTMTVFRAHHIYGAFDYFKHLFSYSLFSFPIIPTGKTKLFTVLVFMFSMLLIEWLGRNKQYAIEQLELHLPKWLRWCFYFFILALVFVYKVGENQFIYFQF